MGETNSPTLLLLLLLLLHSRTAATALFLTAAQLPKGGNWKVAILVRAGERAEEGPTKKARDYLPVFTRGRTNRGEAAYDG